MTSVPTLYIAKLQFQLKQMIRIYKHGKELAVYFGFTILNITRAVFIQSRSVLYKKVFIKNAWAQLACMLSFVSLEHEPSLIKSLKYLPNK